MLIWKKSFVIAGFVSVLSTGAAVAAPILNLKVLGSTTGTAGTFTSDLSSLHLAAGSSIFYEVTAQFATSGTSNTNASPKTPDGSTDSINSMPRFTLTDGNGTFTSGTINAAFSGGSGAGAGASSGNTLAGNRAIASPGTFVNADSAVVLLSGNYQIGSTTTSITASTDSSPVGSIKLAGSPVAITSASESSADPYINYTPLSVANTPEPASLSLLGIGTLALLGRRRQNAQLELR